VNNDQLRKSYQSIYHKLANHYGILMSESFLQPTVDEVIEAIKRHSVKDMPYISNISDCEKFAWYLVNGIQKERSLKAESLPETERKTWALGWITGMRKDLLGSESHTMATAMTSDEGIIIIDPMSDNILKPDHETFDALLMVM